MSDDEMILAAHYALAGHFNGREWLRSKINPDRRSITVSLENDYPGPEWLVTLTRITP